MKVHIEKKKFLIDEIKLLYNTDFSNFLFKDSDVVVFKICVNLDLEHVIFTIGFLY